MLDHLLKNGTLVDGTGKDAAQADIGIKDGKIVSVTPAGENGKATKSTKTKETAKETHDIEGKVVCPGFIDPHTHYDAQLFWDNFATPSNIHGVTTAISGNCGFTLAPITSDDDADYIRKMMAQVEGMPLSVLESELEWNWREFGDYLKKLEGNLGLDVGFLAGHSAIRRKIMGERAVGEEANEEEIEQMTAELSKCIEAGALGFSSSQSYTHTDGDGQPIPSRWATKDEMLAFAKTTGEHEGTTLEYITDGCMERFSEEEMDMMTDLSVAANRPLNWNVLTVDAKHRERVMHQVSIGQYAKERGGRVISLTMPTLVGMNLSFGFYCALVKLPDWEETLTLPIPERMKKLKDPTVQEFLYERSQAPEAGVFLRLTGWESYRIGDTYSEANKGLTGKTVAEIARDRGGSGRGLNAFETLCDIVVEDKCETILWPHPTDDDPDSWALRAELWDDDTVLIGGSDAGAHLDRMCGAPYPTDWISDTLRGKKLTTMESAIQKMTNAPAQLFGLKDRGIIAEGYKADLVVFDPETIGAEPVTIRDDLPGNQKRLWSGSQGVEKVFLNGVVTVKDGESTGEKVGNLIRSGKGTKTVKAKS